jgi:hypothetical protein
MVFIYNLNMNQTALTVRCSQSRLCVELFPQQACFQYYLPKKRPRGQHLKKGTILSVLTLILKYLL